MKKVIYSTQFRRDLKRYRNKPKMLQVLVSTINMLQYDIILPETMRPHKLVGDYQGCMWNAMWVLIYSLYVVTKRPIQ